MSSSDEDFLLSALSPPFEDEFASDEDSSEPGLLEEMELLEEERVRSQRLVKCFPADCHDEPGRMVMNQSIYNFEALEKTSDCVDFVVYEDDLDEQPSALAAEEQMADEDEEEEKEEEDNDGEPVRKRRRTQRMTRTKSSAPKKKVVIVPESKNLIYRFRLDEILKTIAEDACIAVNGCDVSTNNEWDAEHAEKALMIPFLTRPLTAEHMSVIVAAVFRVEHLKKTFSKASTDAIVAYFAHSDIRRIAATRLIEYVYCRGNHRYEADQLMSAKKRWRIFDFESNKGERLRNFTRAHALALDASMCALFEVPWNRKTMQAADAVAESLFEKVAPSIMKLLMTDMADHLDMTRTSSHIHECVATFDSDVVYEEVANTWDRRGESGHLHPIQHRGVDEKDVKALHGVIRGQMLSFFAVQEDDSCNEAMSYSDAHVVHVVFFATYTPTLVSNIEAIVNSCLNKCHCELVTNLYTNMSNIQKCLVTLKLNTRTHIVKTGFASPSNTFVHLCDSANALFELFIQKGQPIVAVLSPYCRSMIVANGSWVVVGEAIKTTVQPTFYLQQYYTHLLTLDAEFGLKRHDV